MAPFQQIILTCSSRVFYAKPPAQRGHDEDQREGEAVRDQMNETCGD